MVKFYGAESLQLMNDFSQLTIDTAPRGRASGETIPGQEVRIQDDHSLTTIREELNNQNENIIKLGSMMTELAKTLTDMLHVQTLNTTPQTHGAYSTMVSTSHPKTNRTMPSPTPPPGSGYRLVNSTHCEVCGSVFFSPKALQNHMNKHHPNYRGGPAGSGYKCEICGQQFAHLGLLQFHRGKYHPDYLARESGRIKPSSSAINNQQLFTSTQDALQQSQSQLPSLQRQNAPHNGHSLSTGEQQPATAHPPRRLRQEQPSQTRNQNRHPLPQDSHFNRTPYTFQS